MAEKKVYQRAHETVIVRVLTWDSERDHLKDAQKVQSKESVTELQMGP